MKTILFLLDGVGDRGQPSLGGLTPLQASCLPNLDRLTAAGETGLMVPLAQGIPLGTDQAHYLIFGYTAEEYPGRAVIDAIGEGIPMSPEDIVLRTSWATVNPIEATPPRKGNEGFRIQERFTPSLSQWEVNRLAEDLPEIIDGFRFEWRFSHDSHGFLLIRDCGLDARVSDSDPFYAGQMAMRVVPFETETQAAVKLSELINKYMLLTHDILSVHEVNLRRRDQGLPEANFMLTKWAGSLNLPEPFTMRTGLRGAVIASSKLLKGVAISLGMDYFECPVYEQAVPLAHNLNYDFVLVHTKSPDTAAHTKDPHEKITALELLDPVFSSIPESEDILYIVTGDHSTASSGTLIHSGESVPVVFLGNMTRKDLGISFDEVACGLGGLRITSGDIMPMILNFTDRAKLYHLRAGSKKRLYRAEHYTLLR